MIKQNQERLNVKNNVCFYTTGTFRLLCVFLLDGLLIIDE